MQLFRQLSVESDMNLKYGQFDEMFPFLTILNVLRLADPKFSKEI